MAKMACLCIIVIPAESIKVTAGVNLAMKKLKNEAQLLKEAIRAGVEYGEKRGVVEFEATDTQNDKIEYIYKLLVHDKAIQPLALGQQSLPNMRHKLALWISRQLPADHPLLK